MLGVLGGARQIGTAVGVGIEARAFFELQLEELDEAHLLAGARDVSQSRFRIRQHDAGGGHIEELDAALRERLHEVDDVVVVDEGVGECDERLGQELLSRHPGLAI